MTGELRPMFLLHHIFQLLPAQGEQHFFQPLSAAVAAECRQAGFRDPPVYAGKELLQGLFQGSSLIQKPCQGLDSIGPRLQQIQFRLRAVGQGLQNEAAPCPDPAALGIHPNA